MSPNSPSSPQAYNQAHGSGDIDLFELFQSLWQEKVLIVLITAVITALAVIYALTATPIYQTQASLVPPPAYAIQGYNEGRMEAFRTVGVKELSVDEVYKVFKTNLNSLQLRTVFFTDVYIPSLSTDEQKKSRDSLQRKFNRTLSVKQSDPNGNKDLYQVSLELNDPVLAADWVKLYIERAIAATKLELKSNIQAEQKVHLDTLSVQTKSLLDTAKIKRQDQIKLLKEALYIAESISLEGSSPLSDKASLGGSRYIDNDLIYTRGAKTLRAQLNVLENRNSDEPFIAGFRELNTQLELLQAFQLDDSKISVVQIDEIAEVPSTPIKPKKALIVVAALVLGSMFGVFFVLVRSLMRKRKAL